MLLVNFDRHDINIYIRISVHRFVLKYIELRFIHHLPVTNSHCSETNEDAFYNYY